MSAIWGPLCACGQPWYPHIHGTASTTAGMTVHSSPLPEPGNYRPRSIAGDPAAQECLICGALVTHDGAAMQRHSDWHAQGDETPR